MNNNEYMRIFFVNLCKEYLFIDELLTSFLFTAISSNNLIACQFLLEKHPDLLKQASKEENGDFPIHLAARFGTPEIVQFLLTQDPDSIRRVNKAKELPIHLAAKHGNLNVLDFFFTQDNASIKHTTSDGRLPLHLAVQSNSLEIVQFLLGKWPESIKHTTQDGRLPLHFAAQSGSLEIVQFLADQQPESIKHTSQNGFLSIHFAAQSGSLETVQFLADQQPESIKHTTTPHGFLPIHFAAQFGALPVVRFLAEQWPESIKHTTQDGRLPLHCAAPSRSLETVRFLLGEWPESIKHTTQDGRIPLHCAAQFNSLAVVRFLVEQWPESIKHTTQEGLLPLHSAAKCSTLAIVQFLASQWPESVQQATHINTFLCHYGACNPDIEVLKFCVNDSHLMHRDHKGRLPLHYAVMSNRLPNARLLVQMKPDCMKHAIDVLLSSEEITEVQRKARSQDIWSLITLESERPPQAGREPIFHHNLSSDMLNRLLDEYKKFCNHHFRPLLLDLSRCSLATLLTFIPLIRLHISNLNYHQENIEVYKKINFIYFDEFFNKLVSEIKIKQSNNTIDQNTLPQLINALQAGLEWHYLTQGTYEMGGSGLNTHIQLLLDQINQQISPSASSSHSQPQTVQPSASAASSSSSSVPILSIQSTPLLQTTPPRLPSAASSSLPRPVVVQQLLSSASSSSSSTPSSTSRTVLPGSAKRTGPVAYQKATDKRPRN